MLKAMFLTTVVITAIFIGGTLSCDTHGKSDGCSIPWDLPYWYKDTFKPDCEKHDMCYACGKKFGISRWTCDFRFAKDLITRCLWDDSVKLDAFCLDVAVKRYFTGVRLLGMLHYEDPSLDWCSESWVQDCL